MHKRTDIYSRLLGVFNAVGALVEELYLEVVEVVEVKKFSHHKTLNYLLAVAENIWSFSENVIYLTRTACT